jgi:hypothetical protein
MKQPDKNRPTTIALPPGLPERTRATLERFGFRKQAVTAEQTAMRLPRSWYVKEERYRNPAIFGLPDDSTYQVFCDSQDRARVELHPQVALVMPPTNPDDLPVHITRAVLVIVNRFLVEANDDGDYRIHDRALGTKLRDETSRIRSWSSREAAEAWLDEHYSMWRHDPARYWPSERQTRASDVHTTR